MRIFGKKQPRGRSQHPDPAVELKLRNIAAIDSLRAAALHQIASCQAEIASAQEDLAEAIDRKTKGWSGISLDGLQKVTADRVARAEEAITRQYEVIFSLGERLGKAVSESGLTDADLSYLNLEDQ